MTKSDEYIDIIISIWAKLIGREWDRVGNEVKNPSISNLILNSRLQNLAFAFWILRVKTFLFNRASSLWRHPNVNINNVNMWLWTWQSNCSFYSLMYCETCKTSLFRFYVEVRTRTYHQIDDDDAKSFYWNSDLGISLQEINGTNYSLI